MEIITTTGAGGLALSGSRALPGARAMSGYCAAARLRVIEAEQPAEFGWPRARRDLAQPHFVQFQNFVASIGTDVPVAGRMRVSAPEP